MDRLSRALNVALPWLLALWIAYIFIWYLQYKFFGHEGSVWLFTVLTDWLGFSGFEKIMRIGVGTVELGAAILCLDHPEVQAMLPSVSDRRIITYGFAGQADIRSMRDRAGPAAAQ